MPAAYDVRANHDANFATYMTNADDLTTARNSFSTTPYVFVDFDGHTTGSGENPSLPRFESTNSNYTLDQRRQVLETLDVAFSPFNVRFTTNPSRLSTQQVGVYAGKVLVGQKYTIFGGASNPLFGGQGSLNAFGETSNSPIAAVQWDTNFGLGVRQVALNLVHEVGHNMGFNHKGRVASGSQSEEEYYQGHTVNTGGNWRPWMGAPTDDSNSIYQWSKGDYRLANRGATNFVDEVASLTTRLGVRADDHPDVITGSHQNRTAGDGRFTVGVISTRTDVDIFKIQWTGGPLSLRADPVGAVAQQGREIMYGNVDAVTGLNLKLEILNTNGAPVFTSDPSNSKSAQFVDLNLPAGTWYARVDGVGDGSFNFTGANSTGFDDYGSLGGYVLGGAF